MLTLASVQTIPVSSVYSNSVNSERPQRRDKERKGKKNAFFFCAAVCPINSFWPNVMAVHESQRFSTSVEVGEKMGIYVGPYFSANSRRAEASVERICASHQKRVIQVGLLILQRGRKGWIAALSKPGRRAASLTVLEVWCGCLTSCSQRGWCVAGPGRLSFLREAHCVVEGTSSQPSASAWELAKREDCPMQTLPCQRAGERQGSWIAPAGQC